MLFRNKAIKYYSPEEGAEPKGGGAAPTPAPEAAPPAEETPPAEEKPPVEAATLEEGEPEPKKEEPKKEEDTSNLGKVKELLEKAGLDLKEVAAKVKANDGQIDLDTMIKLKEEHGDAVASLVAEQIKGIHKEQSEAAAKRDQEVYDFVLEAFDGQVEEGSTGKDVWDDLAAWAKDNVSNEHRNELNKLLGQGGLAAKLAAQELANAYKEANQVRDTQEADLLEGDSSASAGDSGHISKSDYTRELNALLDAGHVYGQSREIARLDARRSKSLQAGY